jgi:hypothetical protein
MKATWILSAMFVGIAMAAPVEVVKENGLDKRQVGSHVLQGMSSYSVLELIEDTVNRK